MKATVVPYSQQTASRALGLRVFRGLGANGIIAGGNRTCNNAAPTFTLIVRSRQGTHDRSPLLTVTDNKIHRFDEHFLRFSFLARAREDTKKRVISVEEVQRAM